MDRLNLLLILFGALILLLPLIEVWNTGMILALAVPWVIFVLIIERRLGMKVMAAVVILVLLLQAQWGLAQFVRQDDLGMYLLGETRLNVESQGIAKFAMGSEKIIRAYGPYPHANSYAGCLVLGLLLLAVWITRERTLFGRENMVLLCVAAAILMVGIIVSFSRTAYLVTGFIILFMSWQMVKNNRFVTWKWLGIVMVIGIVFGPLVGARMSDGEDVAVSERLTGAMWAGALIGWQGVGLGNYPESLKVYLDENSEVYKPWQIDYVHSVPLLMAVELGAVVMVLLLVVMLGTVLIFYRDQWWWLLGVSPLILFDHYIMTQAAPLALFIAVMVLLHRRPVSVVH